MAPLLTPIANWVRSRPALRRAAHAAVRAIPDVGWTTRVPDLGSVRIRLRRHRWFLWESFGTHDAFNLGLFERTIRPGAPAYDIGANIGVYSRVMRQWFEASPVLAFEPMLENFALLEANVALCPSGGIQAFRLALADRNGEESLQVDDVTSGTAVLDSVSGGEASCGRRSVGLPPRTERVSVRRLDDLIRESNLRPPGMMKIDTEGAEVVVLEGARETLRAHRPNLVIALHGDDKAEGTLRVLGEVGCTAAGMVRERPEEAPRFRTITVDDARRLANNNIAASFDASLFDRPVSPLPPGPRRSQ
jgi:FkbM family methyltransferase